MSEEEETKTHILIYNQEHKFNQFEAIVSRISTYRSIVQNNMVLSDKEVNQFLGELEDQINLLTGWITNLDGYCEDNMITEEQAALYSEEMSENLGKLKFMEEGGNEEDEGT